MPHVLFFPLRRYAALVSAGVAVCALAAWTAPFHLHLVKSVPAANATVAAAPDSIRLWFSQPPELKVTSVKVTGPGTADVSLAPLAERDSALVVAPVKAKMAPGVYTVAWRTMAKDGHVARGTFAFRIGAASGK
jgi:copper resistance protein C